ncbi:hypothetical protein niasHT_031530 [Heterodera trifolii]|uniref:Uncharacterized protein n=1 Tax=Heterodera trifolii TaxID=157864 RepID=A0ABD2HSV3_9BILA
MVSTIEFCVQVVPKSVRSAADGTISRILLICYMIWQKMVLKSGALRKMADLDLCRCQNLNATMTEQHFGINCIDLELPMHISQFTINVSASLFDLSCVMFLKERDLDQLPDNYLHVAKRWQLEACEMVPTVMRCKKFSITRTFPLNINAVETAKKRIPIFLIDFGNKLDQSALREKTDGIELLTDKDKEDTIGAILPSIVRRPENGCRTKSLHFIPPADTYTRVFFQLAQSGVSVLVNREKDVQRYENNPNITSPSRCDVLGDDCQPTRELLLKAEQLLECCSPSKHYPCTCGRRSPRNQLRTSAKERATHCKLMTFCTQRKMRRKCLTIFSKCAHNASITDTGRTSTEKTSKAKTEQMDKIPDPNQI